MRYLVPTAVALTMMASSAFAQGMPAQSGPSNPAVKAMHDNNSTTPVAGANSFTKGEATKQIEAKGYTNVSGLKKDQSGVWRGMAMKDGQKGPISVDYQGNVN
jgi:membrane protease subunit (stomatin/prohibitin family)